MKKILLLIICASFFVGCKKEEQNEWDMSMFFEAYYQSSLGTESHFKTDGWLMFFDVSDYNKFPKEIVEVNGNCLTKSPIVDNLHKDGKITLIDGSTIYPIQLSVKLGINGQYWPTNVVHYNPDNKDFNDYWFKRPPEGEYVVLAYKYSYGICDDHGEKYSFKKIAVNKGMYKTVKILFPSDKTKKGYFEWNEF